MHLLQNTNEGNTTAAKEGVKKSFLQNLRRDLNIGFLVFIKRKFLEDPYPQSFQEQVVMFSSAVTLSEKKTLTVAVPDFISTFFFS